MQYYICNGACYVNKILIKKIHTYIHTYIHTHRHTRLLRVKRLFNIKIAKAYRTVSNEALVPYNIYTYIISYKYPLFILYISKTYTKYLTNYNTLYSPLGAAVYNRHTHVLCQHKRHVCYRLLRLTQHYVVVK